MVRLAPCYSAPSGGNPLENGNSKNAFSTKDALLLVPLTASALALCWEVGSFIPIGHAAFSYFSINEHVAFAASVLPLALVLAVMMLPARSFTILIMEKLFSARELEAASGGPWPKRLRVSAITGFVVQVGFLLLGVYMKYAGLVTYSTLALVFICIGRYIRRSEVYAFFVIAALLISTGVGVDTTRARINSTCCRSLIQTTDGDVSGVVVVRTGERGLLFFDPSKNRFVFKKWESVKQVDWPREPLFR